MLRFLPYLIVCLLFILGGRMFTMFDRNKSNNVASQGISDLNLAQASTEANINNSHKNSSNEVLTKIVKEIQKESDTLKNNESTYNHNIKDLPNVGCISHVQTEFSPTEIDILKSLKQRREELEGREQELMFKENTIQLTKAQIDERLKTLQLLKDELKIIIKQYDVKEAEKNARLIRIYENMKPKEAARIFEEMQLNVLLEVVEKMRETRLAPILASMEPFKAKEITVALVNRRKAIHN